ncbi:MAG: hypothetical protein ACP5UR_16230 [Chloroflexus sp.]
MSESITSAIIVRDLVKTYEVPERDAGLWAAVRSLVLTIWYNR